MMRFTVIFLLVLICLFTLEMQTPVQQAVIEPFTGLLARISAALIMAANHTMLHFLAEMQTDIGEVLTRSNRFLIAQTDEGRFITLFLGRLLFRRRRLGFSSATFNLHAKAPVGWHRHLERACRIDCDIIDSDARFHGF